MSLSACNMSMNKWVDEQVQAKEKWRVATTCISVCMQTKGCMHPDCQHPSGLTYAGCAAYPARWLVASQVILEALGARCRMILQGVGASISSRDGIGYPNLVTQWIFTQSMGIGDWVNFLIYGIVNGHKVPPVLDLWVWVCSYNILEPVNLWFFKPSPI